MFGDFKGYSDIKTAIQANRIAQVSRRKVLLSDAQLVSVDIRSVNAKYVVHAALHECAKPAAQATTYVNDTSAVREIDNRRHDLVRGASCAFGVA